MTESFFKPPPPRVLPSSPQGAPAPRRGERGMAPLPPRQAPRETKTRKGGPHREVLDLQPQGFLCGDPKVAYYDEVGHYVVVRAKGEKIVERLGPPAAIRALSAADREKVRLARRRERERRKKGGA